MKLKQFQTQKITISAVIPEGQSFIGKVWEVVSGLGLVLLTSSRVALPEVEPLSFLLAAADAAAPLNKPVAVAVLNVGPGAPGTLLGVSSCGKM